VQHLNSQSLLLLIADEESSESFADVEASESFRRSNDELETT
jgi:hypothetical protein